MNIHQLIRPNIAKLKPYSSARSLYKSGVLMDANENPFNLFGAEFDIELNRYPDSSNQALRARLAQLNNITEEQCAVGNGSDELIDLLIRIFCEPGKEEIIITSPTYGMYEVSANINNVKVIDVPLVENQLNLNIIEQSISENTKIIFLCSPNNPTGDVSNSGEILTIVKNNNVIVVVDEAYADFMLDASLLSYINQYPNLVIIRTLSKAFGMAGIRLGYIFADKEIINLVQKVKPPYNINRLTNHVALKALSQTEKVKEIISELILERERIAEYLKRNPSVSKVYSSQSNFILFKIKNADEVFAKLVENGIIIRSRTNMYGLQDCLRVSIGTKEQNNLFIKYLQEVTA